MTKSKNARHFSGIYFENGDNKTEIRFRLGSKECSII